MVLNTYFKVIIPMNHPVKLNEEWILIKFWLKVIIDTDSMIHSPS